MKFTMKSLSESLSLFLSLAMVILSIPARAHNYKFALIPKSVGNPFFDPSGAGCEDQAKIMGGECIYIGPAQEADDSDGNIQAEIIRGLIKNKTVDAMAISVRNIETIAPAINEAIDAGIPVVTFDSDAPDSGRSAYIGTDNYFFGQQIAKVLKQLKPNGGTFGVLTGSSPNLQERLNGFLDEIFTPDIGGNIAWEQLPNSPGLADGNTTRAMEVMDMFAALNPTAIAPVMGLAMRSGSWEDFVNRNRQRNITLVSGDGMPNQLDFLSRRYAHGLVGQLPYEMGFMAVKVLEHVLKFGELDQEIFGTNVVTHIQVPLILPELEVDHNLIGNLVYVGYILFGIVSISALIFGGWTFKYRDLHVVKVSQPGFLMMVAAGVLIMASSIIPLSFDDNGDTNNLGGTAAVATCMSVPWLGCTGFTMAFSALFAKTMRVNRIFHSKVPHARVRVTSYDVLFPFAVLLSLNFVGLICWTVLDPMTYERKAHAGTDGWNRVISTYGSCTSENATYFLIPLAIINLSVLILANWQAYEARALQVEFSESKYIGLTMASLLQAGLSGIPLLFVVREIPEAFYLVLIFMLFIVCMATLFLIFIPKIILKESYSGYDQKEQKRLIAKSIRTSHVGGKGIHSVKRPSSFYDGNSYFDPENTDQRSLSYKPSMPMVMESELEDRQSIEYASYYAAKSFKNESNSIFDDDAKENDAPISYDNVDDYAGSEELPKPDTSHVEHDTRRREAVQERVAEIRAARQAKISRISAAISQTESFSESPGDSDFENGKDTAQLDKTKLDIRRLDMSGSIRFGDEKEGDEEKV